MAISLQESEWSCKAMLGLFEGAGRGKRGTDLAIRNSHRPSLYDKMGTSSAGPND